MPNRARCVRLARDRHTEAPGEAGDASDDRRYRYELSRIWDAALPPVLFVGMNPSTADEEQDDPTIRRCIRFARDWGYGGLLMGNLYALRATDPQELTRAVEPPDTISPIAEYEPQRSGRWMTRTGTTAP